MTDQLSRLAEPTDQLANADVQIKVSIVNSMADVEVLEKLDWIKTCSNLADHFTVTIFHKYRDADGVRLIFDRFVTPACNFVTHLVTFVFILVIITHISGHVIQLLGMNTIVFKDRNSRILSGRLGTYQLQDY